MFRAFSVESERNCQALLASCYFTPFSFLVNILTRRLFLFKRFKKLFWFYRGMFLNIYISVLGDSINGSGCNLGYPRKSSILGHAEKWPVCSLNDTVSWSALPEPALTAHTLLRPLTLMTAEPNYLSAGSTRQC